jgi:hypothetical protein
MRSICHDFDLEVARLESQLLQLYRLAALAARNEESLEQTEALWGSWFEFATLSR